MKNTTILGCDISKKTIDVYLLPQGESNRIPNNTDGFARLNRWLKKNAVDSADLAVVMEHTGLYSYQFERWLQMQHYCFCKVNALAIKRSLGMIRGKNDAIDARRIARFGLEKVDQLRPSRLPDALLGELNQLLRLRDELVSTRTAYTNSTRQLQECMGDDAAPLNVQSRQCLVDACNAQLQLVEDRIEEILHAANDSTVGRNIELLDSVPGIGPVVAAAMVVATENFTRFATARAFACYCGTAPFEHTSGISIRGRSRVSKLANNNIKRLLYLAACSAIRSKGELRDFYLRKVEEGKAKRSAVNMIMNKVIWRMFSVIKREQHYVKVNYQNSFLAVSKP